MTNVSFVYTNVFIYSCRNKGVFHRSLVTVFLQFVRNRFAGNQYTSLQVPKKSYLQSVHTEWQQLFDSVFKRTKKTTNTVYIGLYIKALAKWYTQMSHKNNILQSFFYSRLRQEELTQVEVGCLFTSVPQTLNYSAMVIIKFSQQNILKPKYQITCTVSYHLFTDKQTLVSVQKDASFEITCKAFLVISYCQRFCLL